MLKRGTVILVRCCQQILTILTLTIFVVGVLVGLMLYSVSTPIQTDRTLSADAMSPSDFPSLPLRQGQPE